MRRTFTRPLFSGEGSGEDRDFRISSRARPVLVKNRDNSGWRLSDRPGQESIREKNGPYYTVRKRDLNRMRASGVAVIPRPLIERVRSRSRRRRGSVVSDQSSVDYGSENGMIDLEDVLAERSRPHRNAINDAPYDFTIPRLGTSEDSVLTNTKETEDDADALRPGLYDAITRSPDTAYNVFASKYHGEGIISGEQRAELTVLEELKKHRFALYRWVHFHDHNMNFDNFKSAILSLPNLSDAERSAVLKLLSRVKRKFDKPLQTQNNLKVSVMEAGQEDEEFRISPKSGEKQVVRWMSVPFFSLSRYSKVESGIAKSAHPLQTLLQTEFPSIDQKRDMQQAICHVNGVKNDYCYHVDQIWHLVIGNSLLVTCTRTPLPVLLSEVISVNPTPSPGPANSDGQRVLVRYGDHLLWSFPLELCQSWFSLISRFAEFWPGHILLQHNAKDLTPETWPRIQYRARLTKENVILNLQRSTGPIPPLRGVLPSRSDLLLKDAERLTASHDHDKKSHSSDGSRVTLDGTGKQDTGEVSVSEQKSNIDLSTFSVFPWLSMRSTGKVTQDRIKSDLRAIDEFLSKQTHSSDRLAYRRCPSSSWEEVYRNLYQQAEGMSAASSKQEDEAERKKREIRELQIDIFNSAESLVECFMPLSSKCPTVDKFWGALHRILESLDKEFERLAKAEADSDADSDPRSGLRRQSRSRPRREARLNLQRDQFDPRESIIQIDGILSILHQLKDILSHTSEQDRIGLAVPDQVVKSWLHILLTYIHVANNSDLWERHAKIATELVYAGSKVAIRGLIKKSLSEDSVVMPHEIVTLMNLRLLQDLNNGQGMERNIKQVYWEYLAKLDSAIEEHPLDRSHQNKLTRFIQEVSIIRACLSDQRSIYIRLENSSKERQTVPPNHYGTRSYARDKDPSADRKGPMFVSTFAATMLEEDTLLDYERRLNATDPNGYRDLLIQEYIQQVEAKMADFEEMEEKAKELQLWNIERIEMNKDRQNAAIYAFTIVTIIFLPLGTVAGILGMNTSDIRNMDQTQWVFWTVALPLLGTVVVLCLVLTIDFKRIWAGVKLRAEERRANRDRDRGRDQHRSRSRSISLGRRRHRRDRRRGGRRSSSS